MEIKITRRAASGIGGLPADLVFGENFTDHMFQMGYAGGAWSGAEILPYGDITISPAASVLHYGQAVFEGLKAFRHADGGIHLFRPEKFYERLATSCARLAIPAPGREIFLESVRTLVAIDAEWVPRERGQSLYLRPFIFASESFLGVRVSRQFRYMLIASPVGAYYKGGLKPVKLTTCTEYVRAAKGGLGAAKTPANYAASLLAAEQARENGYAQVIWLDAAERRYLEEAGAMNIFAVIGGVLVTPPLEGSILPGVTRDSILVLALDFGIRAAERRIAIDEIFSAAADGALTEVFGAGTAAVVSPVGEIAHGGKTISVNDGAIGPVAQRLYNAITAIQYGESPDRHGWLAKVR